MTYTLTPPLPRTQTPDDYTRIHFDPSEVPAKRIVGLLACQRDPLLRSLRTRIVAARPAAAAPLAQKGRQKKKTPASSAAGTGANTPANGTQTPTGRLWEVELEDTVVFPEGGGQPWDTGSISIADPNGGSQTFPIESCVRRKLDAVHVVRLPESMTLEEGQEVTVEIDWTRRLDHMAIHTGQHLLSAVLDTRELPTLSWAMSAYPTTEAPYIELPRGLTWTEAAEVEEECNARIREARKVWIDITVQQQEVADPERASELERENRSLPKDYSGGVIRHCNIDGIDRNACCGTQCPDLSLVSFLHVLPPSTPYDATEPSSKVPTRLYFVCGPRAVAHLAQASRNLSQASQLLGVARDDFVDRLRKMDANRLVAQENEKGLRNELAKLVGEAAVRPTREDGQGTVSWVHRTEKSTHDYDFLVLSAQAWAGSAGDADVVIFTSTPPGVSPTLLLVQGKEHERAKSVFEDVKTRLAGGDKARVKGGGARGRFMAKVDGKWGKSENAALQAVVDAA